MINVSKVFSSVSMDAATAEDIVSKVAVFVQLAEGIANVSGSQKLAAVGTALQGFLEAQYPAIQAEFSKLWPEVVSLVNGMVALFNALDVFVHAVADTVKSVEASVAQAVKPAA